MTKMLIICHDGLDSKYVKEYGVKYFEDNEPFNFRSHYQCTCASWASIYTGLTQRKHGMPRKWQDWVKNINTVPKMKDLHCIWDDFNALGLTVGLYDLPMTHPPTKKINGWIISGHPASTDISKRAYPKNITEVLVNEAPTVNEVMDDEIKLRHGKIVSSWKNKETWNAVYRTKLRSFIDEKLENVKRLNSAFPVDVLLVGFGFVDVAHHYSIDYDFIHEQANYSIEELRKIVSPQKTIIVSDHGINKEELVNHSHRMIFSIEGGRDKNKNREKREWGVKRLILRDVRKLAEVSP